MDTLSRLLYEHIDTQGSIKALLEMRKIPATCIVDMQMQLLAISMCKSLQTCIRIEQVLT